MPAPRRKIVIKWSQNFAYAIGLIASDGNVSKERGRISLKSAEHEMIQNFKSALGIKNKNARSARGGEKEKKYININFRDVVFYNFLNEIGIMPAKSKTIERVDVPNRFFADFVRGVFDGDGSFYTFWDTRWPSSFGYQISFASASEKFLKWLKRKLQIMYGTKGFIRKGDHVFVLRYVKGDTRKIFSAMYHSENVLYLKRKHDKMALVFELEKEERMPRYLRFAPFHGIVIRE